MALFGIVPGVLVPRIAVHLRQAVRHVRHAAGGGAAVRVARNKTRLGTQRPQHAGLRLATIERRLRLRYSA